MSTVDSLIQLARQFGGFAYESVTLLFCFPTHAQAVGFATAAHMDASHVEGSSVRL